MSHRTIRGSRWLTGLATVVFVSSLGLGVPVVAASSPGTTPPTVPIGLSVGGRQTPLDVAGTPQFGLAAAGRRRQRDPDRVPDPGDPRRRRHLDLRQR